MRSLLVGASVSCMLFIVQGVLTGLIYAILIQLLPELSADDVLVISLFGMFSILFSFMFGILIATYEYV